jgi:hypothetical protein
MRQARSGRGGAGCQGTTQTGGNGFQGIVIIRYAGAPRATGGTVTAGGRLHHPYLLFVRHLHAELTNSTASATPGLSAGSETDPEETPGPGARTRILHL